MPHQQSTTSQSPLLESTLSRLVTLIQDLAPQVQVEITLEHYEDEDAHVYIRPSHAMALEEIERLECTIGEYCNDILLDTGLFIVSAVRE